MARAPKKSTQRIFADEHPLLRIARDIRHLNESFWQRVRAEAERAMADTFHRYRIPGRLGQRIAAASQEEVRQLAALGPLHFRLVQPEALRDVLDEGHDASEAAPDQLLLEFWSVVRDYARVDPRACSFEMGLPIGLVVEIARSSVALPARLARMLPESTLEIAGDTHLEIVLHQISLRDDEVRLVNTALALYSSLPSANPQPRMR